MYNVETQDFSWCRQKRKNPTDYKIYILSGYKIYHVAVKYNQMFIKYTKRPLNIPNGHKIYKCPLNIPCCRKIYYIHGHTIFQHFPFQGPPKNTQIGIYGIQKHNTAVTG
jgi:hypothetical protein